jgi:quercetin dioxygenase-like cupin family protein
MKTYSIENAPRLSPVTGVELRILGSCEKVMLVYNITQPGAVIPEHSHPQDQVGTCIKGEGVLTSGGKKFKTIPGVCWSIPGGESHAWINTGKGEAVLIEAFSPIRDDYLAKAK